MVRRPGVRRRRVRGVFQAGDARSVRRAARSPAAARDDAQPVVVGERRRSGVPHRSARRRVCRHLPAIVPRGIQHRVQLRGGGQLRAPGLAALRRGGGGALSVLPQAICVVPRRVALRRGGGLALGRGGALARRRPQATVQRGTHRQGTAHGGRRRSKPSVRAQETRGGGGGGETRQGRRGEFSPNVNDAQRRR